MISRDDIRTLRTSVVILLAVIAAVAGVVYASAAMQKSARLTLKQHESELKQARLRIQNADLEKGMIGRYLGEYQRLAQAGFVGDEQRINWIDSLRAASFASSTFGVEYDISVQRPYPHAAELNPGQLDLQQSVMKLRFQLLHEGDLAVFFDALQRQGGGLFTLDECTMRRSGRESAAGVQVRPNVTADCLVSWLTVKPKPEGEKKK